MATLDSLPADQRAVLSLVLQRGRGYDEIARVLSIDRAAVRQRALTALDLLGPQTGVPAQRRALITDYLLGQLPPQVSEQTRDRLAQSPTERAWARVLASELSPLAPDGLPEIPTERSSTGPVPEPTPPATPAPAPVPTGELTGAASPATSSPRVGAGADQARDAGRPPDSRRSSRLGGLILILAALVIAAVVVVMLASSGGSAHKNTGARPPGSPTPSTTSGATAARVLATITLTPPTAASKAVGIAELLRQGTADGLALVARHVTANTIKPPNAYAVWLYNSPADAHLLGFVNPGVTGTGRLSTAGGLPAGSARYKQLIVTLETKAAPTTPGTIILQGTLKGLR